MSLEGLPREGERKPASGRPNLLLIQVDQQRYDCLGVNGHPWVQTPNLDRLAGEGVNFTRAYCPAPVCVPTRVSLVHGQWPTEHLAIANAGTEAPRPAVEGLPSFTQALRGGGYLLGHVGKWQVHPERGPEAYGFHQHAAERREYETWRAAQDLLPRPGQHGWFGELDPHVGPEQSRPAWQADHVIGMIREFAGHDAPFFIQWDPEEPHVPNVLPEPYCSMYPPQQIPPWPSFPDPLIGKPYIQAQQRRTWRVEGWMWEQWAPIVSRYLAQVSLLDAQVGRILHSLDKVGLAQRTMVVYTTDHGGLCGGHGMIDKHYVMYEDVTHVPLIVRWPGHALPGHRCAAWVSHSIDLATTFCQAGGVPVPDTFRGRSLLPLLEGEEDNSRQDIWSTYHGNQFGLYSQRMVRDERWKYVWNATAEDELYDLALDPGEVRNLATDPAYRGQLARLRHRMVEWMDETRDPLLNGWTRTLLLEGLSI